MLFALLGLLAKTLSGNSLQPTHRPLNILKVSFFHKLLPPSRVLVYPGIQNPNWPVPRGPKCGWCSFFMQISCTTEKIFRCACSIRSQKLRFIWLSSADVTRVLETENEGSIPVILCANNPTGGFSDWRWWYCQLELVCNGEMWPSLQKQIHKGSFLSRSRCLGMRMESNSKGSDDKRKSPPSWELQNDETLQSHVRL